MITLQVGVSDTGVLTRLNAVGLRIRSREIIDEANAVLLNRIRTNFLNEVNPFGVAWIPSKAGIRRRSLGGTGTLFDTGRLFRSIQANATSPYDSTVSTDVPYAAPLQNNYPFRVFLNWSNQDQIILDRLVQKRLQAILGGTP